MLSEPMDKAPDPDPEAILALERALTLAVSTVLAIEVSPDNSALVS